MYLLIFIFIFLLGTIIGSFLNVVIYRFNTGRTIVSGRSICMSCSNHLRWYELIPLFSFLIQRGKCRRCASRISHQYPLVEFGTGLIFVLIAFKFLSALDISYWFYVILVTFFVFIFSLLMVITVYDLRHKIIPDELSYTLAFVSLVTVFINYGGVGSFFTIPTLGNLIAGPLLALPFVLIWYFSKGKAMGLGDGKLVLGLGWVLGISSGLCMIILSFWIGAVVSLLIMLLSKHKNKGKMNMKTEVPFAPFLIISTLITFLFNLDIFTLSSWFIF